MSKVVKVEAMVSIYITVPDDTSKLDVYRFLADNIDWNSHLKGISDPDQTMRVTGSVVVSEEIVDMELQEDEEND